MEGRGRSQLRQMKSPTHTAVEKLGCRGMGREGNGGGRGVSEGGWSRKGMEGGKERGSEGERWRKYGGTTMEEGGREGNSGGRGRDNGGRGRGRGSEEGWPRKGDGGRQRRKRERARVAEEIGRDVDGCRGREGDSRGRGRARAAKEIGRDGDRGRRREGGSGGRGGTAMTSEREGRAVAEVKGRERPTAKEGKGGWRRRKQEKKRKGVDEAEREGGGGEKGGWRGQ